MQKKIFFLILCFLNRKDILFPILVHRLETPVAAPKLVAPGEKGRDQDYFREGQNVRPLIYLYINEGRVRVDTL